jgi:hypothetical protein
MYQQSKSYDVVFVTSNADLTAFRRFPLDDTKIVFEMVDSYLAVPDWEPKALVRGMGKWLFRRHKHLEPLYRRTVAGMCQRADLVMCSMPEQRAQMAVWNNNVHDVLDFHDELVGNPCLETGPGKRTFDLFWEGVAITAFQFSAISEVLREVAKDFPLRLHLLTDLKYRPINAPIPWWDTKKTLERSLSGIEFYLAEWNPASVRAMASQCDLGLIPMLLDKPLCQSKPENKLLIMWRLGLPVIVSATPAYTRTMKAYQGPNWACSDSQDWHQCLREALESPEKRALAAKKGELYANADFGADALLQRWTAALATLVK